MEILHRLLLTLSCSALTFAVISGGCLLAGYQPPYLLVLFIAALVGRMASHAFAWHIKEQANQHQRRQ